MNNLRCKKFKNLRSIGNCKNVIVAIIWQYNVGKIFATFYYGHFAGNKMISILIIEVKCIKWKQFIVLQGA